MARKHDWVVIAMFRPPRQAIYDVMVETQARGGDAPGYELTADLLALEPTLGCYVCERPLTSIEEFDADCPGDARQYEIARDWRVP